MEKEMENTKLADLQPTSAVTDLNGAASLLVMQEEAKSKREVLDSPVTNIVRAFSSLVIQEEAKSKREVLDPPVKDIRGAASPLVIQEEAKPKKTTRISAAPVAVIVELLKDIKSDLNATKDLIRSEKAFIRSELELLRTDLQLIVSKQEDHDNHLAKLEELISARNSPDIGSISEYNWADDNRKLEMIPRLLSIACDTDILGGNWTVILRRQDGSINFYRNWANYKNGFGDMSGEFFMGLDKIHALTADGSHELLVLLQDFEGVQAIERYDAFTIGSEDEKFALKKVGNASGSAGDSLSFHLGARFSTHDSDNDCYDDSAVKYTGAWWYACSLHESNLTGTYNDNRRFKGVNWYTFRGYEYSVKKAVMMIRPRQSSD